MNDLLMFEAVKLTADKEARTFRAPLLPYGEQGRTNWGKVTAAKKCTVSPRQCG